MIPHEDNDGYEGCSFCQAFHSEEEHCYPSYTYDDHEWWDSGGEG